MPQSAALIEINDLNFATLIAGPTPVLVDFTAVWCAPCRAIAPHLAAIAEAQAGRVLVGKYDVDGNTELAARHDVRAFPTLLLFVEGRVVGQLVGAVPRAKIEALLEKALGPRPAVAPATPTAAAAGPS